MEEMINEQSGSVERLSLDAVKAEQAKIQFEETIDKIINDPNTERNALAYLKAHREEYKEIFGHDLNVEE